MGTAEGETADYGSFRQNPSLLSALLKGGLHIPPPALLAPLSPPLSSGSRLTLFSLLVSLLHGHEGREMRLVVGKNQTRGHSEPGPGVLRVGFLWALRAGPCLLSLPPFGGRTDFSEARPLGSMDFGWGRARLKDCLQNGLVGSPCSPRDSQESSPPPQFKSINSSALSLLHSPTLTSIHEPCQPLDQQLSAAC